ncbi:MAG: hypothetical protein RIQ33_1318 [Bacteroidota bacterium]|jgi:outer membrane receptor protein involved in Fe transport
MKKIFSLTLILSVFLFTQFALAQEKFTINGYVKDAKDGETFIGASVRVKDLSTVGAYTNSYGFYAISLPKGSYTLLFSYLGYQTIEQQIVVDKNQTINIELSKNSGVLIKEILITDRRKNEQVKNTQMGKVELSTEQIKNIPAIFGEVDILKAIQLLPGVQSAGEGLSGFYVRGGGPDQNLVLLDNATVYNTGHLFGFFSVFNSDAIKNTTLIKGGMPANFGGRLSSVVDVNMKEGNSKQFKGSGGIGLIASRLTLEGPWKKNKGSFMVSGRRTYIDALVAPFIAKSKLSGSGYYFYDFNIKANYKFSDKDRLYLSGYFGRDVFNFKSKSGSLNINMPWGNSTGTLRWNHLFNEKLFCNTSLIYNDYQFKIGLNQNNFNVGFLSSIKDWNLKSDFDYYLNEKHNLKFGLNYTFHTFNPNAITLQSGDLNILPDENNKRHSHETALYVLDDWTATKKIKVNVGLRYAHYMQTGPYDLVSVDADYHPTDTVHYAKNSIVQTFAGLKGLEPRLTLRYELTDKSSFKAAYSHNNQFIHLVSQNGVTLPTDIWVPSTKLVKPQISDLYAVGYFHNFKNNMFETSVEVYYKSMQNQIEYREFYVANSGGNVENNFTFGKGESHGIEFFINKQYGKLTGWLGYTLSYTNRKFAGLNNNEWYPTKFDRRHDVSFVMGYEINEKWKCGATWVYGTGNAITVPDALYQVNGTLYEHFTSVNGYRMPAYHRTDLSATYTPKRSKNRRVQGSWTFSVYNVYKRFNPFFIFLDTSGDITKGTATVKATEVSLFPFPLPSITWNFKF